MAFDFDATMSFFMMALRDFHSVKKELEDIHSYKHLLFQCKVTVEDKEYGFFIGRDELIKIFENKLKSMPTSQLDREYSELIKVIKEKQSSL